LFDEEELMFDAIQNPVKARKEKDIGKVRAYVRVITSLGGSLNMELYCEKVCPTLLFFALIAYQRQL
jgi:peptidyl-prolyl cis-trans isomerase-like 2